MKSVTERTMEAMGERCDVCGARAEYILSTSVRGCFGQGWQELATVYPDRKYCLWHFALLADHASSLRAKQEVTK